MSNPVNPLSFPYKPNGGFTNDEIWGRPSPSIDKSLPSADTQEAKLRIQKVAVDTLEKVIERYSNKYLPNDNVPSGNVRDYTQFPANEQDSIPIIRISGTAASPNYKNLITGLFVVGMGFVVFKLLGRR